MTFVEAATLERLQRGPVVLSRPPRQVAVFRVDGQVYAVDNRCPHEGYPLSQGTVDGDVLTCNWHNWKFRLGDGRCLLGGDHVRAYPVRVEDGRVLVDLSDPPPEAVRAAALEGLASAFDERDEGRVCRELCRLQLAGLDPQEGVRHAVERAHDRLEYGTTHAFAAAADWMGEAERHGGDWERRLVCLAEPIDHMAHDVLRQPAFAYAAPAPAWDGGAFGAAIEAEDREQAEALAGAAARDGLPWAELEPVFAAAALAHSNDFGHALIYVQKTGELLARLGSDLAPLLLPPLARMLAYCTREDLVPEFAAYAPALAGLPEPRAGEASTPGAGPSVPFPATLREALDWLGRALADHPVETVFDALLAALARNLLAFDTSFEAAYDRPVAQHAGWLDFTHALTFSNAVHELCARQPSLWRPGLAQMACFLGRNRRFLDEAADEAPWRVEDQAAFLAGVHERLLDHGLRDPIFSAHLLKTAVAVEREAGRASPGCRAALLAALNRFVHAPLKQKHVRRMARAAIELVGRDRPPSGS